MSGERGRSDEAHDSSRRPQQADTPDQPQHAPAGLDLLPLGAVLGDAAIQGRGNGPLGQAAVQRLQTAYGNRTVSRWLNGRTPVQREENPGGVAQAPPAPTPAPAKPVLTKASQEAEAAATLTAIQNTHKKMLKHENVTIRNTAKLFLPQFGQPPRLKYTTMVLRSDSDAMVAAAGGNPATSAYFFYGPSENNSHNHPPKAGGTIDGDTIAVRGQSHSGEAYGFETLAGTFAHEASHILVASYGEHPKTSGPNTDAGSFDRYKDEFRAYWIDPLNSYAKITDDKKRAAAIRTHMVGSAATPPTSYFNLQDKYWSDPAFKAQIDAHEKPDGFNPTNSPGLDMLYKRIAAVRAGTGRLEDVQAQLMRLEPREVAEAAKSTMMADFMKQLSPRARERLGNAISYEQQATTAKDLNPTNSPRIAALLDVLETAPSNAALKAAYSALQAGEKGDSSLNVTLMKLIDLRLGNVQQRAAMYAMLGSGKSAQFDALWAFLDACRTVIANSDSSTRIDDVPATISSTLNAVEYEARLAFYKLVPKARGAFVDLLPESLQSKVIHALREGTNL